METRARYVLIGLFTVAIAFVGFAFVYWMQNTGGLGPRAHYRVRFESPVSGLTAGSAVLFNGVRVGEVIRLKLNNENPRWIEASIAIDPAAPMRVDTRVGVDFQGLTGVPVILLAGGAPAAAPIPAAKDGEPPLLVADPASGVSMMQAGRQVLLRLDGVIADNADALHGTLDNLNTFSGSLSRNSERVDGIFAGLERLTGGGKKGSVLVYDLTALKERPAGVKTPGGLLAVPEPSALQAFDSEKIQARPNIGGKSALEGLQWADNLPKVVQEKVLQSFENAGFGESVSRPVDAITPDYQLLIDIRLFQISAEGEPSAQVEFGAKVVTGSGRIAGSRVFRQTAQIKNAGAKNVDAQAAAAALDEAFGKILMELAPWASELASKPVANKE
jgi:phospholipid/cholesterol/gamma-HCH transport system substrate-binding protein